MQSKIPNSPAFLKGFLWLAFSAAAMLSAFILPIHLFAVLNGSPMKLDSPLLRSYFFILIIAALYHGLYRAKTILFDLGLEKYQKTIGWLAVIIFLFYAFNAAALFFFSL